MFENLGPMEMMMILVIVLVLFGAKRVPEIGASIGKGIREFKRGISDLAEHAGEGAPPPTITNQVNATHTADTSNDREPKRLFVR